MFVFHRQTKRAPREQQVQPADALPEAHQTHTNTPQTPQAEAKTTKATSPLALLCRLQAEIKARHARHCHLETPKLSSLRASPPEHQASQGSSPLDPASYPSSHQLTRAKTDSGGTAHPLATVVHEAPRLMEMLSGKDRSALSACNQQLRHLVHMRTKAICVHNSKDVARVINGDWPQLALILLRTQHMISFRGLCTAEAKLQLLAGLNLSQGKQHCAALVVAAKPEQQLEPTAAVVSSQFVIASAFLCKAGIRKVEKMTLWQAVPSKDYAAQLTCIDWPTLTELNASGAWLTAASVAALTDVLWPALVKLDLHGSNLRADANMSPAWWNWSQVQELVLSNTDISTATMSKLADVLWPCLCKLDLSRNKLMAGEVQVLASARMPVLETLQLENNRLDATAAAHLAQADWPRLSQLWLYGNHLNDVGIEYLSKGCWPELCFMLLNNNVCTNVTSFSSVRWPKLMMLMLDKQLLCAPNLNALGLSCDILGDLAAIRNSDRVSVSRHENSSPSEEYVWPNLANVLFVP